MKETLPLAALVDVGVNCTPRVMLCPAGKVFGSDSPLIANPLPVTLAAVRSRLVFPLLIRVTLSELVWPMVTLLKFKAVGESVSVGSVPVPASETDMGESVASLVTVREPLAAPADCGAKRIWTVELWPAGIVDEGFPPTILNAAPEIAACEIFTVAVPVLVTLTLSVLLLPTTTPPKLRLVELAESVPVADPPCEPVVPAALVVYPAQLESPMAAESRAIIAISARSCRRPAPVAQFAKVGTTFFASLICACVFMARTV